MRILFDNNAFAYLTQQPEWGDHLKKLKGLVVDQRLHVIGCCTLLQELAGLAASNERLYLHTLSHYEELIHGQVLQLANDLVIIEGEQLQPVALDKSLLEPEAVKNLFDALRDPGQANLAFGEVKEKRDNYSISMSDAWKSLLSDPHFAGQAPRSISKGYQKWFNDFHDVIQDWFIHLFDVKTDFAVAQLPLVSALLGYTLTRIYEARVLNIKDRANDLFDRAYYTDAAVVDILVTNDGKFNRTSLRVRNRTFDVLKLEEFASLIEQRHFA